MTDKRPTLHLPKQPNFKPLGDLPPEKSAWWHEFGRKLDEFHRDMDGKK